MTAAALRARVLEYLRAHHVMTLATQGADGPWAAAVFYVHADDLSLYFLSSPKARHSLNVGRRPRVSATIHEDYADWPAIKGVQLEGIVTLLQNEEARSAQTLYARKFPVVGLNSATPAAIAAALARVRWYRLAPDRLYFIDNAAGFGRREALDLASAPVSP